MCLILFACHSHPDYPLAVAANRDEFYERPTAPAAFWQDHPDILAGRDLKEGGSWMGIHRTGRLAAITNYRDIRQIKRDAPSRGKLVSSFLMDDAEPETFLKNVHRQAQSYNGFSLLLGNYGNLLYYSSTTGEITPVEPGIHGLSNHLLDSPWPKVERGKNRLREILDQGRPPSIEAILDLLGDGEQPPDHLLPDTGVGIEWERMLSTIFISSPFYGTFSSTVLLVHRSGAVTFVERDCRPGPTQGRKACFEFTIN